MTMPDERTRALIWAGAFLVELAKSNTLPIKVRQQAVWIARHFPTVDEVRMMAMFRDESTGVGLGLAPPEQINEWLMSFPNGALLPSTRLKWPDQ